MSKQETTLRETIHWITNEGNTRLNTHIILTSTLNISTTMLNLRRTKFLFFPNRDSKLCDWDMVKYRMNCILCSIEHRFTTISQII